MSENEWIEELYAICSLPRIDILKYLWSKDQPIDTHTISRDLHISMEEVYEHLNALQSQGLVKMESIKTKTGDRRFWTTAIDKFSILITADKGNFTYKRNLGEESLETITVTNEKRESVEIRSSNKINIILYLVAGSLALSVLGIVLQFIK